jgi:hypothetical protein
MSKSVRDRWVLKSPQLACPGCGSLVGMEFHGSWNTVPRRARARREGVGVERNLSGAAAPEGVG